MTADLGGALPRRQMRALVAAGFRDWPSPLQCPAYAALFPALCEAIDADGEAHTPQTWTRFLAAVARCRSAIGEGRQP